MLSFSFSVPFAPLPELTEECLGQEQVSSHNLASRIRAIVCSENDLLSNLLVALLGES